MEIPVKRADSVPHHCPWANRVLSVSSETVAFRSQVTTHGTALTFRREPPEVSQPCGHPGLLAIPWFRGFPALKDTQGFPWSFHPQRKSEAAGHGCPESRAGQGPGQGTPIVPGQRQPSRGRTASGAPGIWRCSWHGVHCLLIPQPACLLASCSYRKSPENTCLTWPACTMPNP